MGGKGEDKLLQFAASSLGEEKTFFTTSASTGSWVSLNHRLIYILRVKKGKNEYPKHCTKQASMHAKVGNI
jgi:hypothetical protein